MQSRLNYLLSVISKELSDYRPRLTSIEVRLVEDIGFIRLSFELSGSFTLEVREVWEEQELKKYAYYLLRKGMVIVGCDNAPHHRLTTFPHHYHRKERVEPFSGKFEDFLKVIKDVLPSTR